MLCDFRPWAKHSPPVPAPMIITLSDVSVMTLIQQALPFHAGDFLPHLLQKRVDAPLIIGLPWPNPAASNDRLVSLRWLSRPSSKFSKPTGSPRPMRFVATSPENSIRPGRHSSATCPAQCPGV